MTEDKIAYIKYYGKKTKHGVIDLTSAAHALSGLSDIIRFFNLKQNSVFSENSYEIPVKINEGSWEAAIIENPFTTAILTGASIFAGSYLKKAGEKIAENDFNDISFKKILQRSMNALIEFIKIKKNGFNSDDLSKSKSLVRNGIVYVLITLPNGTQIEVENEFLEWYKKMPPTMLQKVVHVVEQERRLEVAVFNDGEIYKETINEYEKSLFIPETKKYEEELLLPHLVHNNRYHLEGILTRGNQSSNSLGFKYSGHILNCHPESGDVAKFKDSLFKKCIIDCYVNRNMKTSLKMDRKPTLIIISSSPIDEEFQTSIPF